MRGIWLLSGAMAVCAVATPAQAEVVIGPRFSYYFDNSNLRTSDLEGLQDARATVDVRLTDDLRAASGIDDLTVTVQDNGSASNADQVGFPMIGGMVNFGDDRHKFTFIGMFGKGTTTRESVSSRLVEVQAVNLDLREISVIQTVSDDDVDRLDLEFTWQRRINENFAISAGARYERLNISGQGSIAIQETDEVRQFVSATLGQNAPTPGLQGARKPARVLTDSTLQTFSARVGVTAFVPFNDDAVAFFNGMIQSGYQPESTFSTNFIGMGGDIVREETRQDRGEFSVGPDFAVGAQFVLTEDLALDIRYRAILSFPLSGDFEFGDSRVNHGVNVGMSLRL